MIKHPLGIVLLCLTSNAFANGGELYGAVDFGFGATVLRYVRPGVPQTAAAEDVIRYGLGLRYGLTNEIHLGAGLSVASTTTEFGDTEIMGQMGRLFASYTSIAIPLEFGWLWRGPGNWDGLFTLLAGPSFVSWEDGSLLEPSGNFRLAIDETSQDLTGLVIGGRIEIEWRPMSWLGASIGPQVWYERVNGVDNYQFTIALRPFVVFGSVPSLEP